MAAAHWRAPRRFVLSLWPICLVPYYAVLLEYGIQRLPEEAWGPALALCLMTITIPIYVFGHRRWCRQAGIAPEALSSVPWFGDVSVGVLVALLALYWPAIWPGAVPFLVAATFVAVSVRVSVRRSRPIGLFWLGALAVATATLFFVVAYAIYHHLEPYAQHLTIRSRGVYWIAHLLGIDLFEVGRGTGVVVDGRPAIVGVSPRHVDLFPRILSIGYVLLLWMLVEHRRRALGVVALLLFGNWLWADLVYVIKVLQVQAGITSPATFVESPALGIWYTVPAWLSSWILVTWQVRRWR